MRTTLLIKNLPGSCNTEILAKLLDDEGFAGCYDFAYVPFDFRQQRAFGYAFVNFCDASNACEALNHLHGSCRWAVSDQDGLEVQWSDPHQGLQLQIARYQNSPVLHESIPEQL